MMVRGADAPVRLEAAMLALLDAGVPCAPHVVTRLLNALDGDLPTVVEAAALLTTTQRQGLGALPSPLPCTPSIARRFKGIDWAARDHDVLLAAALCLDDALTPLLAFDGRDAADLATGPLGIHLDLRAGRVTFRDPRLAIWVVHASDTRRLTAVHARLCAVFDAHGDRLAADWHRAKASVHGDPGAATELVRIARELSEAGHAERALMLAAEAASHAEGADRDEARVVAGAAAVGAGYAAEAAAWLGSLFPDGTERCRLQGLAGLLVAQGHLYGGVPGIDPGSLRPATEDAEDWYSWTRAAALGAVLCAGYGDRRGMRAWLDALREGSAKVGADRSLRDPTIALSWLLIGDETPPAVAGSGPLTGALLGALRAALAGDIDEGLRLLRRDASLAAEPDPLVEGFEFSPVVRAYLAVIETLLLVWRGDIGVARQQMADAALGLPVALPFGGLGVVLMRRLDLAVRGELGAVSRALTAALPPAVRLDLMVDDAIRSFLAGAYEEAASTMRLWSELGSPRTLLSVPGLDELLWSGSAQHLHPTLIEPPGLAVAERLSVRAATATDARWRREHADIAVSARGLRSPFARARVELMLGVRASIKGDGVPARVHLRSARSLFGLCGAAAWARHAEARLERLDRADADSDAKSTLLACRRAWAQLLTDRELDVAMLVAEGATNRVIADELSISVRTVEVHLGRVFAKLDVRSRVELTVLAHRTERLL